MNAFESIQKTINYAQKYGGQLTEEQLFERLIGNRVYPKEEINDFIKLKSYKVIKLEGKNKILEEKIKKAKELAKKISKRFPEILFLGITGSVAAGYPKKNDDIDLIVITKVNKLWLARLRLRFFVVINKIPHRKFGKKEKENEFCFNLWLDERSLRLKKEKQNLKNAVDLILIKPLINRNRTYEKFILANDWAKKYVATGYSGLVNRSLVIDRRKKIKENLIDKMINFMMFWPQFLYMKKRIKKEKVGLHEAFFHH